MTAARAAVSVARAAAAVACALTVTACSAPFVGTSSAGSCAGPQPVLRPNRAAPGQVVHIIVNLSAPCQDTNHEQSEPVRQWTGIRIRLVRGETTTTLAVVDTDPTGQLDAHVTIPSQSTPGIAVLHVDDAQDTTLTIT